MAKRFTNTPGQMQVSIVIRVNHSISNVRNPFIAHQSIFLFIGNYVISNFLKSYISSSRDRLLSCPSLTITLQIRPMCDASNCDDLRLIKVRNGSTVIDEPSFTYQWVIDDFNTKTKVCLSSESL